MTEFSPVVKTIDNAFWKAQTNVPDIYSKGRTRLAAAFRAAAAILRDSYANEVSIDSADDFLDDIANELEVNHG